MHGRHPRVSYTKEAERCRQAIHMTLSLIGMVLFDAMYTAADELGTAVLTR